MSPTLSLLGRRGLAVLPMFSGLALGLAACSEPAIPDNAALAGKQYASIVAASYEDSVAGATVLATALGQLVNQPSVATLTAARKAWLDSREVYLQTEAYRFYDGPIEEVEGQVNAWPMDENYVDYVESNATAGVVNDPAKPLAAMDIVGLNGGGGDENVATGFHPIEFLLWGQDLSDTGPGARPHTDYVVGGTAANQDRRGTYLLAIGNQLLDDLTAVSSAWATGAAYRTELEAAEPGEQLRRILTGLIVLSGFETGGERLQAALDSGDQEDEHSCFSDNTHRDMVQDVRGVQNVYLGSYTRPNGSKVSGVSIYDVVAARDQALADVLRSQIATSLAAAEALQPPFDREIALTNTAGRARVTTLITSLRAQEAQLQKVFQLFALTIPQPE